MAVDHSLRLICLMTLGLCFGLDSATQAQTEAKDFSSELPRIQPLSPQEALAAFEVAPGFEIQQAAAEPLITDPVAMSFDERGRLYVIEMNDYSEQEHDALGKVRLLEDTNHDGVFDKSTVFAEGLSWPTAIICANGGVFVGAAPDILFLKDTNGNRLADEKRKVFTGFNRSNIQGLLNSFRWGLDNRIHGATSSSGGVVKRVDVPDSEAINLRGRDYSFDPIKLDLRAEAGGAQHGISFANFGRKFVCSNSDHAQYIVYDDHYLSNNPSLIARAPRVSIADDGGQANVYRSSPVEPWRIVRTRLRVSGAVKGIVEGGGRAAGYFTGATGITIYRGDAFGTEHRGTAFIGDVGSNIVHRKQLIPSGVTYTATRIDEESEFVRSSDIWFRPVQFANAPDGCLYILDMYREVIEHPKSLPPEIKRHLDLTSGRDRGRLYRVAPIDHPLRSNVDLSTLNIEELVDLLDHENSWHRETACRLIIEQAQRPADKTTYPALLVNKARSGKTSLGRVHALWLLQRLQILNVECLQTALNDPAPEVVEQAIKLSEPFAKQAPQLLSIEPALWQQNPHVAMQLAFSAHYLPSEQRLNLVTDILSNPMVCQDAWIQMAALSSLSTGAGKVLSSLLLNEQAPQTIIINSLVRLIARQNRTEDIGIVLDTLQNGSISQPQLRGTILVELISQRPELREKLDVGTTAQLFQNVLTTARQVARDASQTDARRTVAIQQLALSHFATEQELLESLLNLQQSTSIQSATLDLLGQYNENAISLILTNWNQFSPGLRQQAESILFSRDQSVSRLFDLLEDQTIPISQVSIAQLKIVANHKNPQLRDRAKQLLQLTTQRVDPARMTTYRAALETPGDVKEGREIFRKTCATCHKLEGAGFELGPNLATMQNRGAESILVNVLDPNREVNPKYLSYVVNTVQGRTYSGMIQSETPNSLTLVRGENKSDTIARVEIEQLKSTGLSLMPEDLHKTVTPRQLNDLIAYLLSVK